MKKGVSFHKGSVASESVGDSCAALWTAPVLIKSYVKGETLWISHWILFVELKFQEILFMDAELNKGSFC